MNTNKPLISVITVCFNAVDTIEQTIKSVLMQDYSPFEYIVVDGGSTDGTVDIINRYLSGITAFVSEPDNGIYDAMNKGVSLAKGEWIHFRNSGDLFVSPDTLGRFFEKNIDEEVGVVHGDCVYVNDWGYKLMTPNLDGNAFLSGMPVLHPASFVRASLQKGLQFNLKYRMSADYDFMYRCCKQGIRFEYRHIPVAVFPVGGAAMQNIRTTFRDDNMIRARKEGIAYRSGVLVLSIKCCLLRMAEKVGFMKSIRKAVLIHRGWKPLPFDVNSL